jgi:hypothetical protein
MILDVDFLIDFFNKHASRKQKKEIGEQDDAGATSTGGGGTSSVPKWADSYPLKRGPANMLGKKGEKWSTDMTRGAANQIW